MRKALAALLAVVAVAVASVLMFAGSDADARHRNNRPHPSRHDFSFSDVTAAQDGVQCTGPGQFDVAGLFQAAGASTIQIVFHDNDLITYNLADGQMFDFTMFAGSNEVDRSIRVKLISGNVRMWISAEGVDVVCSGL